MIKPNPAFRPNPTRAVYVHGHIDQALVHRLIPQIVRLQQGIRGPITIYIDSPGGSIPSAEALWRLLKASDQDFSAPCRTITVVTSRAASAAADLLSSGDYAIAYAHSTILYHGSRINREMPITLELTSALAHWLRITNETYAMELVRKIESRFMFRFIFAKPQFAKIRAANAGTVMSDTECFLSLISDSLSARANRVFEMARERQGRYEELLKAVKKSRKYKGVAKTEASRLKAIVEFELEDNKKDKSWTFQGGGLTRLNDDFFLLNEHLSSGGNERLNRLCAQWGTFALTPTEKAEIDKVAEAQRKEQLIKKVRPLLEPLWTFFVALCHALQEGENELTATDAFWLGLIDEVVGDESLQAYRMVVEYEPDPPPQKKEPDDKDKGKTAPEDDKSEQPTEPKPDPPKPEQTVA